MNKINYLLLLVLANTIILCGCGLLTTTTAVSSEIEPTRGPKPTEVYVGMQLEIPGGETDFIHLRSKVTVDAHDITCLVRGGGTTVTVQETWKGSDAIWIRVKPDFEGTSCPSTGGWQTTSFFQLPPQ